MSVKKRGHRGKKRGKNARDALKRADNTAGEKHSQGRMQAAHVLIPEQNKLSAKADATRAPVVERSHVQVEAQNTFTLAAKLAMADIKEASSEQDNAKEPEMDPSVRPGLSDEPYVGQHMASS
jgi:hypothetical protein